MNTKEKILQAAKEEFVKKGYENASLRDIAAKVGISATALYRHYENKEKIFDAVVAPALHSWESFVTQESERQPGMAREQGLEAMWNDESQLPAIVDMIFENRDEHKLLICQSEGSKYAGFLHELVTKVQQETIAFMQELKAKGIPVKEVNEHEMHLLMSAEYSAVLEILDHDFSHEEARHYARTVTHFFTFGWRDYLGF